MSVGHILSMPSPVWDIICSCHAVQLFFICGCSREKKILCAQIWHLLFLHKQQWEISTMLWGWVLRAFLRGCSACTGAVQFARMTYTLKLAWVGFLWYLHIVWPLHFPPSLMHESYILPKALFTAELFVLNVPYCSLQFWSDLRLIYTEKKHVAITEETLCFSVFLLTFIFSI